MINLRMPIFAPALVVLLAALACHGPAAFAQQAQQGAIAISTPDSTSAPTAPTATMTDENSAKSLAGQVAANDLPRSFKAQLVAAAPVLVAPAQSSDNGQQPPSSSTQTSTQTGGASSSPAGGAPFVPFTSGQKMSRAFSRAFLSPFGYARTAFSAALTQAGEDDQPHKSTEDKVADGFSRFAIKFSTRATRTMLSSGVYPVLFRQDPRYDRAPDGAKAFARLGHAVSRVVVQRGDNGRVQFAASRIAGSLSASALSNLWERSTPGHDRIGADATFRRFRGSFVNDAIFNVFREFWPDIRKILGR